MVRDNSYSDVSEDDGDVDATGMPAGGMPEVPPFQEAPVAGYTLRITGTAVKKTVTLYGPDNSIVYVDKFDISKAANREEFARKAVSRAGAALAGQEAVITQVILDKATPPREDKVIPPAKFVDSTAGRPLAEHFVKYGASGKVVFWRNEWFRFNGTCYEQMSNTQLHVRLRNHFAGLKTPNTSSDPSAAPCVRVEPSTRMIHEAEEALLATPGALLDDTKDTPFWIDGRALPKPANIKVFANGILDMRSRVLQPATDALFAANAVDFDYAEMPEEPKRWMQFLDELFEHDPEAAKILQEITGYLLTSDTSLHKIFMLFGPIRGGKGTWMRILMKLVGAINMANPTLASLAGEFGLQPLIHKLVAVIGDARLSGRTDASALVERLLTISGGDALTINRKNLPHWTGQLTTRFVLVSNDMPRLTDTAGAFASRCVVVELAQSWEGREERDLDDRLAMELPGIFSWALDGLHRLMNESGGKFTQTQVNRDAGEELKKLTTPIKAFLDEFCLTEETLDREWKDDLADWEQEKAKALKEGKEFRKTEPERKEGVAREIALQCDSQSLLTAWEIYCDENSLNKGYGPSLGKIIHSQYIRNLGTCRKRSGGQRLVHYKGLGLTDRAERLVMDEIVKKQVKRNRDMGIKD